MYFCVRRGRGISCRLCAARERDSVRRACCLDIGFRHMPSVLCRRYGSHSKLRTYKMFKSEYETENYLTVNLPIRHRSALAKFRCWVAPLRIETGRYERLPLESRLCSQCNSVESECHVICDCPLYEDLRNTLFEYAKPVIQNFETLNSQDKMCAVLSNTAIVKYTANLHEILVRRRSFI